MNERELRILLEREEGQYLEFKSLWDRSAQAPSPLNRRAARDMVVECVAAFANADGGVLVCGVEDDGSVTGHGYPDGAVAELLDAAGRRIEPPPPYSSHRIEIDGHELLVFDVGMAAEAGMVHGNGFPYRVGDQTVREPQQVINERKQAYRRVGYEQRINVDATIDDLDLGLVAAVLANSPFASRGETGMLEAYALISAGSGHRITNAALLMFGRTPIARWHPHAGVRINRVDGVERKHGSSRNVTQVARIDEPLARAISSAHEVLRQQIPRSERLHDLFFREMPEYPTLAWQEALVNAVVHRDYDIQSQEVEIWLYDDRLEVSSPGEPVPPVTLARINAGEPVHASRNPLMARVLVDMGVMREEGEGIQRMREEMRSSFLRAPEFDLVAGSFVARLRNEPVFDGPSAEWQELVGQLGLSDNQRRVLLAHPERFTNDDFQRMNQVDRDRAYRDIKELVDQEVVTMQGTGRGATYTVSADLRTTRAFLTMRLPALRRFFAGNERLMNSDYRVMFGVSRQLAVQELAQLVSDEYLLLQGERRGAHYVPGQLLGGRGEL